MAKNNTPVGVKNGWIVGTCAIVAAIVGGLFLFFHHEQPTNSQSISNGNGNMLAGRDINYNGITPPAPLDTKQDLRTFFETVNPEILQKIDGGQTQIDVMLGNVILSARISREPNLTSVTESSSALINMRHLPTVAVSVSFSACSSSALHAFANALTVASLSGSVAGGLSSIACW